jgi:hypothetical protein
MGGMGSVHLAAYRNQWRAPMNAVVNFSGSVKYYEILEKLNDR